MNNFILGTLFGGGIVCGVYFGWVHFDFQLFGININSSQLENVSASQCREELKRANQRAFTSDKIAEELRNRVIIVERKLKLSQPNSTQPNSTQPNSTQPNSTQNRN